MVSKDDETDCIICEKVVVGVYGGKGFNCNECQDKSLMRLRMLAAKIGSYSKEDMLNIRYITASYFQGNMHQAYVVELLLKWVALNNSSKEEFDEVVATVRWGEFSPVIKAHIMIHVRNTMGYPKAPLDLPPQYIFKDKCWRLRSINVKQLLDTGSFALCNSDDNVLADYCSCDKRTHPCFTLSVQDSYYEIRDSTACYMGGFNGFSKKGETGHQHVNTCLWWWLVFRDGDDESLTFTSLFLTQKDEVDEILRRHMNSLNKNVYFEFWMMSML